MEKSYKGMKFGPAYWGKKILDTTEIDHSSFPRFLISQKYWIPVFAEMGVSAGVFGVMGLLGAAKIISMATHSEFDFSYPFEVLKQRGLAGASLAFAGSLSGAIGGIIPLHYAFKPYEEKASKSAL